MFRLRTLLLRAALVATLVLFTLPLGCGTRSQKMAKNGEGTKKEQPAPSFTIEAKPDSKYSLPAKDDLPIYVEMKSKPAEVLKGWKVRYTAPAGVDNVKWFIDDKQVGEGSPFEPTESQNTLGEFTVKMEGTEGGSPITPAPTRTLVVGEVQSDSFQLKVGGSYYRDAQFSLWVRPPTQKDPSDHAITMNGKVSLTKESPPLAGRTHQQHTETKGLMENTGKIG